MKKHELSVFESSADDKGLSLFPFFASFIGPRVLSPAELVGTARTENYAELTGQRNFTSSGASEDFLL